MKGWWLWLLDWREDETKEERRRRRAEQKRHEDQAWLDWYGRNLR